MEEETVNQNVTCLLKEICERLKHISQKKGLNMDHVAKLLDDKNKMENLIIFFQYLLDNEDFCDYAIGDFMVRWKPLIDNDVMELTLVR
jgi:hypothetical protein